MGVLDSGLNAEENLGMIARSKTCEIGKSILINVITAKESCFGREISHLKLSLSLIQRETGGSKGGYEAQSISVFEVRAYH